MWQKTNNIYCAVLAVVGILWIIQFHTFGVFMGSVALVTAFFVYQKNRWAYFAAAVVYFGLFRIAMDNGHDFHQELKSIAKLFYVITIIFAFILHEKVAIKKTALTDSE